MKRLLAECDSFLPSSALGGQPERAELKRINELVGSIDQLILKRKRVDIAVHSEPPLKQAVLRVFIHHEFIAEPLNDKPHFVLSVEGLLLNAKESGTTPLGSFFERVSIQTQTEKKSGQGQVLEWNEEQYPLGCHVHCFRSKIYTDKQGAIKICLHRSNEICSRYNISDQLRAFLPYIRVDPTEDEVFVAMWQYLEANGLMSVDRDRRYVRLTEELKELFYGNRDHPSPSILISGLRSRLLQHMILAQPVIVDHLLNPVHTPELFQLSLKNNYSLTGGGRWPTSIAYGRVGGRVFDVEVDIRDSASFRILNEINENSIKEFAINDRIRQYFEQMYYLSRKMQVIGEQRGTLEQAINEMNCVLSGAHSNNITEKQQDIPLYQRIRSRPATERVDAAAHSDYVSLFMKTHKHIVKEEEIAVNETKDNSDVSVSISSLPVLSKAASGRPPLPSSKVPTSISAATTSAAATFPDLPSYHYTSLHTLSGYMDVGSSELFRGDKAWLKAATERLITDESKVKTEK